MASRNHPQSQRPNRPSVQTTSSNPTASRYSYQETPVEMQRPVFLPFSSPTNSTIEESPLTPASTRQPPSYEQHASRTPRSSTPLPEEKALEASLSAPPTRMHPAYNAPVASDRRDRDDRAPSPHPASSPPTHSQAQSQSQSQSGSHRYPSQQPHSPGPLPLKQAHLSNGNGDGSRNINGNGNGNTTPLTSSTMTTDPKLGIDRADSYNPYALQGPNVGPSNHRPGQVSHPNAAMDPHWRSGLCEPDTLCCMGTFCPCLLYGKTMYRLSRRAEKKDPTDLLAYERCNPSCGIFALACGVQGILTAIHRTRIRKLYHIEGSFGADCMKSCCCCCCVLAQNEREVKQREELIRRHAGPVTGAGVGVGGYRSPDGGMQYAAPPR